MSLGKHPKAAIPVHHSPKTNPAEIVPERRTQPHYNMADGASCVKFLELYPFYNY